MTNTATTDERRVSLTFDNGPTPGITDAVLDLLADRAVPATFFAVGARLAGGGADLARRALAGGHRVGHHTATHTVLLGEATDPEAAVADEVAAPAAQVAALGGDPLLFRPYAAGGILDQRVLHPRAVEHLVGRGATCVLWNSVPHDWDDPEGWVDRALTDVDQRAWAVVVLHDVDTGAMAHLPRFLDGLAARGVVPTTELPESCTPIRDGRILADLGPLLPDRRDEEHQP